MPSLSNCLLHFLLPLSFRQFPEQNGLISLSLTVSDCFLCWKAFLWKWDSELWLTKSILSWANWVSFFFFVILRFEKRGRRFFNGFFGRRGYADNAWGCREWNTCRILWREMRFSTTRCMDQTVADHKQLNDQSLIFPFALIICLSFCPF